MMRLFIGFFLSLLLLLSGGSAYTAQYYFGVIGGYQDGGEQEQYTIVRVQPGQTVLTDADSSLGSKVYEKIKAEEIEDDDETETARHFCEPGHSYYDDFYTQTTDGVYYSTIDHLPFCEHFSYHSSYKFILHRVIRV